MNFDHIIKNFMQQAVGRIIVTNYSGEILYAEENIRVTDQLRKQLRRRGIISHMDFFNPDSKNQDTLRTWEYTDHKENGYYRVQTAMVRGKPSSAIC